MGEHFEQIGGQLKAAREAAGLDVDDVVFKTHIPRSVIVALEAEDFSVFTSPVYAKSFLRQYSEFLHVDADPWLNALEPGSFMPDGSLRALVEGPDPQAVENEPAPEHRGGMLSVLGLLTLSAALVVGAIKGYEFFDRRFGAEDVRPQQDTSGSFPPVVPKRKEKTAATEAPAIKPAIEPDAQGVEAPEPQATPEPVPRETATEVEEEELPQPPLRAIPVDQAE